MEAKLLNLDGLSVRLLHGNAPPKILVDNVSLYIERGETLGLIGESGCGKSMTCSAIVGLIPSNLVSSVTSISFNGQELTRLSPKDLRRVRGGKIATIMQNPAICFDQIYTIRAHFFETIRVHDSGDNPTELFEERSRRALKEVGFDDTDRIMSLYPFQMSGGMLQRTMTALALVNDPELLLADEPTTDLDLPGQAALLDLLTDIQRRRGIGILMISHDLSVVGRIADRIMVMRDGRIVDCGTRDAIFESPEHEYSKELLGTYATLCNTPWGKL
jgi:nickel transport system ATP-binding protein